MSGCGCRGRIWRRLLPLARGWPLFQCLMAKRTSCALWQSGHRHFAQSFCRYFKGLATRRSAGPDSCWGPGGGTMVGYGRDGKFSGSGRGVTALRFSLTRQLVGLGGVARHAGMRRLCRRFLTPQRLPLSGPLCKVQVIGAAVEYSTFLARIKGLVNKRRRAFVVSILSVEIVFVPSKCVGGTGVFLA